MIFKVNVFVFLFHDALNISFLGCLLLKLQSLFDCAIDFIYLCCFIHILMLVKMQIFYAVSMGFLGNRDIFTSSDMTQHIHSNVDKSSNSYKCLIENHNSDNILNSAVENIVFSHQIENVKPPLNKYKGHVSFSEDKLNKRTKNKILRPYPEVNSHSVFKNISNLFISNTNTSLIFTSFAPEANVSTIFSSNKMLDKTDMNRGKDHDHDLDHGDQFSCQPISGKPFLIILMATIYARIMIWITEISSCAN